MSYSGKDSFKYCLNTKKGAKSPYSSYFTKGAVEEVLSFHRGMDAYSPTPLCRLDNLAGDLGVSAFFVKDESKRFGLNAFKALGGSYAIARYLCDKFSLEMNENTFSVLHSPEYAVKIKDITFITATDGNHGRGVAWTAKALGCRAVVYLPEESAKERLDNILSLGAEAEILPLNYDDTVRFAGKKASENGWVLVQDTAWDGYETIPLNIMQGYTTLAQETVSQLPETEKPTHLFLQAGVGSMAGAIAAYFSNVWGNDCPKIVVVEPDKADCIYKTALADDGKLHFVTGSMDSMMAGLCCGEPCPIGWDILKSTADAFVSCSDSYSAFGMRMLGKPSGNDPVIVSGESGAVTAGVAAKSSSDPGLQDFRTALDIDENSRILVISTEGDTDRENYKRILGSEN